MFEKLIFGVYTKGKYIKMIIFVEVSIFAMGFLYFERVLMFESRVHLHSFEIGRKNHSINTHPA